MRPISKFKISLIGFFGAFLLKVFNLSIRWRNEGQLKDKNFWNKGGPRICAFWHGRQLLMSFTKSDFERKTPLYTLTSEHQDGQMISSAVSWLGIRSIKGSSSRSGSRAARQMLDCLEKGYHVGITPDGPKGPKYHVKPGVIFLASQSGCLIYPMSYGAKRCWVFNSWDGMILPKPFSKAVRIVGDPVFVPADLDAEQLKHYQEILRQKLIELTSQADNYVYS
jgi:lysophospholipid acyltransferase (LPLAT)-like uncharacterized protein